MRFVDVQIPYRGRIPKINKRGPIAKTTLDVDTAKELDLNYGITLLDPLTGKPVMFGAEEIQEAVKAGILKPVENKPAQKPETAEEKEETPVEIPSENAVSEDTPAPTAESATTEAKPAEFNFTKVEGYSNLSKNKKREIRSAFVNMPKGKSEEEIYAELNAMAKAE